jgi:hypothetical protein
MTRILLALTLPLLAACGAQTPTETSAPDGAGTTIVGATAAALDAPGDGADPTIWRPGADVARSADLLALPDAAAEGQLKLNNGIVPQPGAFPAVLVDRNSSGDLRCTATLIGPETLLTAAHCVDGGGRGAGQIVSGGRAEIEGNPRSYRCMMAAEYSAAARVPRGGVRHPADFALCRLNAPMPSGRPLAETVSAAPAVTANARLLLMGFGCDKMFVTPDNRIGAEVRPGRLQIGDERVASSGQNGSFGIAGPLITTVQAGMDPALCPGDSGGPAFLWAATTSQTAPGRRVVSVNSAVGFIREADGLIIFRSYLAPLSSPAFAALVARYREANPGVALCGLDPAMPAGVCRV